MMRKSHTQAILMLVLSLILAACQSDKAPPEEVAVTAESAEIESEQEPTQPPSPTDTSAPEEASAEQEIPEPIEITLWRASILDATAEMLEAFLTLFDLMENPDLGDDAWLSAVAENAIEIQGSLAALSAIEAPSDVADIQAEMIALAEPCNSATAFLIGLQASGMTDLATAIQAGDEVLACSEAYFTLNDLFYAYKYVPPEVDTEAIAAQLPADVEMVTGSSAIIVSHTAINIVGNMDVIGEVINNGTREMSLIRVNATFFDQEGIVIDTGFMFLPILTLLPGEKSPFTFNTTVDGWTSYELEIELSSTSLPPYYNEFAFSGESFELSSPGSYVVTGIVTNVGELSPEMVSVFITLYGNVGNVVGTGIAIVYDLAPGTSASIESSVFTARPAESITFAATSNTTQ